MPKRREASRSEAVTILPRFFASRLGIHVFIYDSHLITVIQRRSVDNPIIFPYNSSYCTIFYAEKNDAKKENHSPEHQGKIRHPDTGVCFYCVTDYT